ncbi:MAG: hypothetical protein ACR2JB_05195 [Bryobacteraceae bacterium]
MPTFLWWLVMRRLVMVAVVIIITIPIVAVVIIITIPIVRGMPGQNEKFGLGAGRGNPYSGIWLDQNISGVPETYYGWGVGCADYIPANQRPGGNAACRNVVPIK